MNSVTRTFAELIIQDIHMDSQLLAENRNGLRACKRIGTAKQSAGNQECQDQGQRLKFSAQQPRSVAHIQYHKAVKVAEPVRNHVGKMEAMPDIVQLTDDKAEVKKYQQRQGTDFVPKLHIPRHTVEHRKEQGAHAAVQVGKPLLKAWLQTSSHISRHLTHGVQQSKKRIGRGNVQPKAGGKFVDTGLGVLQRRQSRQLQNQGHPDGQS